MYFQADQIEQLTSEHSKIEWKYDQLISEYFNLRLENLEAYEYVRHGFLRRIKTLKRCVENVYTICPPNKSDKPTSDELTDLSINLQSFIFNVFGCIDNLAWVWVKEKQLKNKKGLLLSRGSIGLMSEEKNKLVRKSFSQDFQDYLISIKDWYEKLEGFRHALAHRIPLYVPPFVLSNEEVEKYHELEGKKREALLHHQFEKLEELKDEQNKLGTFVPWMTHSFVEDSPPVVFHAQVLADWNTVVELAEKLLKELRDPLNV